MFDKVFESFRKAAESSLRMQQDLFRQWGQYSPAAGPNGFGVPPEWSESVPKRWLESMTEMMNTHRAFLDSIYKSSIQLMEQTFRLSGAQSPEDYQRVTEDLWRKMSESFKEQTEIQLREFQKAAERWSPAAQKAKT